MLFHGPLLRYTEQKMYIFELRSATESLSAKPPRDYKGMRNCITAIKGLMFSQWFIKIQPAKQKKTSQEISKGTLLTIDCCQT